MRVLLPLFQNNAKDENTPGATTDETTPTADPRENAVDFQPSSLGQVEEIQDELFSASPAKNLEEEDQKKRAAVTATDQRKRASSSKVLQSPKKVRTSSKKPPPVSQGALDSKMTAPKFLDEEREDEILENSPPAAAAAHRNFVVNPSRDVHENDPATTTTTPSAKAASLPYDSAYVQALKKRGLEIVEQDGDGNCLFRAVSLQVYGDPSMHAEVRTRCMDFMAVNEEHFGQFVTGETFSHYIARKRLDGVHGNNPEIQAISELYNRPVEVYTPERGAQPINIFHEEYSTSDIPIRLSYHDGNHYNAVIDPIRPTAGLGLGLPGLNPGLADKQQMASAVMESDQQMDLEKALKESEQELSKSYDDDLQRALKESSESVAYMYKQKALALSDLDATSLEMEQTALESSLQSYMQTEMSRKKRASPEDQSSRARLQRSSSPSLPAYAPTPSVAAAAAAASVPPAAAAISSSSSAAGYNKSDPDEYPPVVQELVMNGFELSKVVRAYELIGDNFDDLLAFLCSSGSYP